MISKIKHKILIVEDNESILFNLVVILELNNYNVITASDGQIALKILKNSLIKPDLIIADIKMPLLNGYELLQEVLNDSDLKSIPFIFLSALATPEEKKLGKNLGAEDYLTKPVDGEIMLSLIKKKLQD